MSQSEFLNEIEKLKIDYDENKLNQLEKYYEMLVEYNKFMNLTGITEKKEVYLKHFYDSLTIVKILDLTKEESLCDLGSGAGFPGIVLKIFFPNLKIVLVDSLGKRINFLNDVIQKLNLKNIITVNTRIEEYSRKNAEKFDVVTARAVAPLNVLLELGSNLVKVNKYFVAMKGNIENEVNYKNSIEKLNLELLDIKEFRLPLENSFRTLIKLRKNKSTPQKFPRKYNEIKKKPL